MVIATVIHIKCRNIQKCYTNLFTGMFSQHEKMFFYCHLPPKAFITTKLCNVITISADKMTNLPKKYTSFNHKCIDWSTTNC